MHDLLRKGWLTVRAFFSDVVFPAAMALLVVGLVVYFSFPLLKQATDTQEQGLAELGRYYISDCQLIEKNIDRGFWSARENTLQCGRTLEHVSVSVYDRAVSARQKQQAADATHTQDPGD